MLLAARISDDDLMDCLHATAYPKRKLDGVSVEESLRSIARSVAPATNATDMARFVGSLFDAMCEFVAEPGSTDFFMIGGDIWGSWKAAPAQLFTRIFLEAISPDMFRHACVSRLIVNDELYARPMELFLMVEREAEAWPRTYHLLAVHASMSTDDLGYAYSGGRDYQQSSYVTNSSHFCPSSGAEVFQNRAGLRVDLFSVRPAKECRRLEATVFLLGVISPLHLYTLIFPDRRVRLLAISNVRTSDSNNTFVVRLLPATVLVDPFLLIIRILQVVVVLYNLSTVRLGCVRLFLLTSTWFHLLRHLFLQ